MALGESCHNVLPGRTRIVPAWTLLSAGIAAIVLLAAGCQDPDTSKPWLAAEERQFFSQPSTGIQSDPGDFFFSVPVGVERERFALAALESLHIGARVKIRVPQRAVGLADGAFVMSLGKLTIDRGATTGSVYALGSPSTLESGVLVRGFLKSSYPVEN